MALGDSFVSGPGIKPMRAGACERSENNFPSQIAAALGVEEFTDASCGGAKSTDLFAPQRDNPPQLEALSPDTTLITFGTLGGNDMGLVGLAASCVGPQDCSTDADGNQKALDGIETARVNLVEGISDAKVRSPLAEIFVVGYGTYLPAGGCGSLQALGITPVEADYIQSMIDLLSDMLESVAAQQGVEFVDMRETSNAAEHTACAAPEKQWIRTLQTFDDGATFHPSYCGHVAMAQQVERTIAAARGEDVQAFDDSCVSAGPPVEPEGPTVEERKAALKKALAATALKVRCTGAGKLKARVRGGGKLVARVEFRIGAHQVRVDRSAPYTLTKKAQRLARHSGKVKAEVRVRDAELRMQRVLKAKRPRCL